MKFRHKDAETVDVKTGKPVKFPVYTIEKAKKDTVIQTRWGEALITKGHYIATEESGMQFGVEKTDFNNFYVSIDEGQE